jgi:hypothetical protein
MNTVIAPPFASTDRHARSLADRIGTCADQAVQVDCRELRLASETFISTLVVEVLVNRQAGRLAVLGLPDRSKGFATAAATQAGVGDRLSF